MKMICSILESCVAIINKHKSSNSQVTLSKSLLMSLKHISNWLQYNVEIEAATGGALQKSCFYKFCKIHKKTPVPESFFLKKTLLIKRPGTSVFLGILQNL